MVIHKRHPTKVRSTEIANATRELISEVGIENLTIVAIANKVGISQGAVYKHFKDKKQILFRVAEDLEKILLSDFQQVIPQGESYLYALEVSLRRLLFAFTETGKVDPMWLGPELYKLHDVDVNEKITEGSNQLTNRFKEFLSQGIKSGEVRPDLDINAAARFIFLIMNGLIDNWKMTNNQFLTVEEEFAAVWRLFLYTVKKDNI